MDGQERENQELTEVIRLLAAESGIRVRAEDIKIGPSERINEEKNAYVSPESRKYNWLARLKDHYL